MDKLKAPLSDPFFVAQKKSARLKALIKKVEYSGLEPLTSTLPVSRSSRMS